FGAETPFLFFCDFGPELAKAVREGRRNEFARFAKFSTVLEQIPDPGSPETFLRSKLDWKSLSGSDHQNWLGFYRNLLQLRRELVVPRLPARDARFHILSDSALRVEWCLADRSKLTLLANLGTEAVRLDSAELGRLIYCLSVAEKLHAGTLAPGSVAWFLS